MTPSLARRTLTTAVSLACCAGLLGLVLGFGAGVWWGRRERVWYVDIVVPNSLERTPYGTLPYLYRASDYSPAPRHDD